MVKREFTRILILLSALVLIIIVSLKSCQSGFEFYSKISDDEWLELEFYDGKRNEYLGKYPGNIFCNVHNLKGIVENELLCLDGSHVVGFGSNGYTKILLNKAFDEPIKRLPIKQIVITNADGSAINIADAKTLNQIEYVLHNHAGDVCYSSVDKFNAAIYFDIDCELLWSCIIEKRNDDSIYLIGYNQKEYKFREFDVTNILRNIYL